MTSSSSIFRSFFFLFYSFSFPSPFIFLSLSSLLLDLQPPTASQVNSEAAMSMPHYHHLRCWQLRLRPVPQIPSSLQKLVFFFSSTFLFSFHFFHCEFPSICNFCGTLVIFHWNFSASGSLSTSKTTTSFLFKPLGSPDFVVNSLQADKSAILLRNPQFFCQSIIGSIYRTEASWYSTYQQYIFNKKTWKTYVGGVLNKSIYMIILF